MSRSPTALHTTCKNSFQTHTAATAATTWESTRMTTKKLNYIWQEKFQPCTVGTNDVLFASSQRLINAVTFVSCRSNSISHRSTHTFVTWLTHHESIITVRCRTSITNIKSDIILLAVPKITISYKRLKLERLSLLHIRMIKGFFYLIIHPIKRIQSLSIKH